MIMTICKWLSYFAGFPADEIKRMEREVSFAFGSCSCPTDTRVADARWEGFGRDCG